jgi:ABC-type glycerol-3-phosphate transport system substrate-binding protein
MKNVFQYFIFAFFGIFIFIAILFFTGVIGKGSSAVTTKPQGAVTIWGTFPQSIMSPLLGNIAQENNITINYTPIPEDGFGEKLTEAVASGGGPDLIIAPHEVLLQARTKISPIPYTNFSARTFRDTFVQSGEIFFMKDGVLAVPLAIDPLILYWNRTLFENAGLIDAPKTWKEVQDDVAKLTEKDLNENILSSGIAMGTPNNVSYFKEILSLLFLQIGNPIVKIDTTDANAQFLATLDDASTHDGVMKALSFFVSFVDPNSGVYTWNRVRPKDQDAFVGEELAMYVGFAHEIPEIRDRNPNINFDVALVPQVDGSKTKMTYGRLYGVSMVKATKNPTTAFFVASEIAKAPFMKEVITQFFNTGPIAPARRDLLSQPPETLYGPTLFNSALIGRSWFDPDQKATTAIFGNMITNVIRGTESVEQVLQEANGAIGNLFNK